MKEYATSDLKDNGTISIISAHAPTEEKDGATKDAFYDALERTIDTMPKHDMQLENNRSMKQWKEIRAISWEKRGFKPRSIPTLKNNQKHMILNDE